MPQEFLKIVLIQSNPQLYLAKEILGGMEYEIVEEKGGFKLVSVVDTQTNKKVYFGIELPESVDDKIFISGKVSSLLAIGGGYSKQKGGSIKWKDIIYEPPHTIRTPPTKAKEIEGVVKNLTGAPFAKSSQAMFTDSYIDTDQIKIKATASSEPVVTIETKFNKWLYEWTMGYYLTSLIERYDFLTKLYVITDKNIDEDYGWEVLKKLAKRGTHVKLLIPNWVRKEYFSYNIENLDIRVFGESRIMSDLFFRKLILVSNNEVHAEHKDGKNIYSQDPKMLAYYQNELRSIWSK